MSDDEGLDATSNEAIDELESALARLGDERIDVPAARLDAVEARVLASLADAEDEHRGLVAVLPGTAAAGARRRRWPMQRIGLVAASLLVIIAVSIGLAVRGTDPLVIAAADGVVVVLPDGSTVDGTSGAELPDDAVLTVTGFVEVGDRRFGPGKYRVDDGDLVALPEPIASDAPSPSTRPPVAPPESTAAPTARPTSTTPSRTTVPSRPPATARPDEAVTTPATTVLESPPPTRPPTPSSTTPVIRTTTTTMPTRTTTTTVARTTTTTTVARTTTTTTVARTTTSVAPVRPTRPEADPPTR